ncbi:MAG: CHAT domain-containing protein, partial [Chloroflexaceae bacterium]|nr:CHAT domain-containing protein [Chloroflexaceae bacterium]
LYLARGEYQRALATLSQVREAYLALSDMSGVAYADLHRSDAYLALNLWQEALEQARAARSIFHAAGMAWEEARLWLNEGVALAHANKRLHDAEAQSPASAMERAREIFAREQNQVWLAAADLYQAAFERRSGNLDAARAAARRAREAFSRAGLHSRAAQCDTVLGEVALAEGDYASAVRHFTCGLDRLKDADLPAVAFACLFGLGRAEQARGRTAAALNHYRQAVANVERLQIAIGAEDYKMAFLSDKQEAYQALALLALDQGTPEGAEEAFETVERAKSRALLDALARGPAAPASSPAEAGLRAEMERLKGELNWYYTRLYAPPAEDVRQTAAQRAELVAAITSRERQLQELLKRWRSPDLIAAPRNPVWTVTAPQLRAALPEDALLLEFYVAGEQIIVFGLTREGMWVRRLSASYSEVAEALGQFRFQINKFGYGPEYRQRHMQALREGVQEVLQRLYQALLAPLADELTASTLVIVPHSVLHYVPFQALFDGRRYLVEARTVSYAPSATVLYRLLTTPAASDGRPPLMLGLTDPTIPYAEEEVRAVAALFPGAEVRLGAEATIASLMKNEERPAFLHLSTHAIFRADNPLFSALKLADGWLSVSDIYGMASSAPLVTLSACETGRNQVLVGDELVGLCRGFFAAGARALVVSLWMVDDRSTARLMARFYDELRAGRPADQALRRAQLETASQLDHPYYWAPFILTGDAHMHLAAGQAATPTYVDCCEPDRPQNVWVPEEV